MLILKLHKTNNLFNYRRSIEYSHFVRLGFNVLLTFEYNNNKTVQFCQFLINNLPFVKKKTIAIRIVHDMMINNIYTAGRKGFTERYIDLFLKTIVYELEFRL